MNSLRFDSKIWPVFPIFVFLVLSVFTVLLNSPITFALDDSYITVANADLLLHGGSDAFGNSAPTGATSPLHLFLLTLFGTVMELRLANFLLSLTWAAAYGIGLWKLLSDVTENQLVAASGTALGFVVGLSWAMLLNGLETGLAMAAVIWALWCSLRDRDTPLVIIVAALPFLRPEFAALSLFLAISAIWRLRREPALLLRLTIIGVLVMAALAVMTYHLTGHLLSPTAAAKKAFFDEPPLDYAGRLLQTTEAIATSPILFPLLGIALLPLSKEGRVYALYALIFLLVMAAELPVTLFHNDFRYLYPLLPLGIAGWGLLIGRFPKLWPLAGATLGVLIAFPHTGWQSYRTTLEFNREQETIALWVEDNLPANARILVHDAGYVPWHTRFVADPPRSFQLVDAVGLKSTAAMARHQEITFRSHGVERGAAIAQIAADADVQYAIILDRPFWRDIEFDLRQAGWDCKKLFSNPEGYQVFALSPPGTSRTAAANP